MHADGFSMHARKDPALATTPKTPSTTASATRSGRYVGRVGGLAVALGIGIAIANGPAVAFADEGSAGAESSSNSKSSQAGSDPSGADSTGRDSAASAKDSNPDDDAGSGTEGHDAGQDTDDTDNDADDTDTDEADDEDVEDTDGAGDEDELTAQARDDTRRATVRVASTPTAKVADEPSDVTDDPATPATATAMWTMAGSARRGLDAEVAPTAEPSFSTAAVSASVAVVSPLATEQQLEAERIAAQTVETWPVKLMKLVLRMGWLSTAKREYDLIGGPDEENLAQLTRAIDEYALGAAFQQQLLNSMQPTVVTQVAPPHTWFGQSTGGSRILYDNPDTIYRFMGVNKTSTYVIKGQFTGEMPADTSFSLLTGLSGITAGYLSARDLQIESDGSFTITVSDQAAAPDQRNHLQLTADSTLVAVRNTLSDWNTQPPMSLSIERVAGPPNSLFSQLGGFAIPLIGPTVANSPLLTALVSLIPPMAEPPPILRGTFTAVVMALGLSQETKYIKVATTDPVTGERVEPNVLRNPTRNAEFLATQLQSAGYFDLDDREALVVTVNPGNARYFNVPVTNLWTVTDDYWNEQTSLNIAQATPNPDGTYTFVISSRDPGVHNWVSTGGLNQGTLSLRFQDLDPESTAVPTVTSEVVRLRRLWTVLPTTTEYLTPAERQLQLAVRKAGFDTRFAPYPQ